MKECSNCKEIKALDLFYKRKTQKDGHRSECKLCEQAYNKSDKVRAKTKARNDKTKEYRDNYYVENNESIKIKKAIYRSENKEKISLSNEVNRPKRLISKRRYQKENPGKVNAANMKRQAARIQATPSVLTKERLKQIEQFYILAKEMEKETGIKYHVDHIVPLQGKTVSGLHVPWNLQILEASENIRKSNTFGVI